MESRTVFCGTLLTRGAVEEEEARGGGERSGRRRAAAGIYEDPRRRRRRHRKGAEEEEVQSRRCGGVGGGGVGTAADHGCRAICDPDRGAYDLLVGRGKAPVLHGACRGGGGGLPRQEGSRLRAGQARGDGCRPSCAVNLLNSNVIIQNPI